MPVVDSLDELNEKIRAWDTADNGRRINDRIRTVGQDFAVEAPLLLPVPSEGFDPGLSLEPRVDRSALITSLDLDHYLEVLRTKPGALPGASALAAARRNGTFTSSHDAFWAAARKTDGDAGGTRQLIDVLLLHRTIGAGDVIAGIEAALTVGAVTADVV
eukprot:gene27747-33542_t